MEFDGMSGKGRGRPFVPSEARRGRAASALPCLFSNNGDKSCYRLTPYQRKNAYILAENLEAMIARFGVFRIGFLTLTFAQNLSLKEANRRFKSFCKRVLPRVFDTGVWVAVREFCKKTGRPHFHVLGVTGEDIRTGFNFKVYLQMVRISRSRDRRARMGEVRQLARMLNPTPALRERWAVLREMCPRYGFGRHELVPIRKSGVALARYVGGYIRKSLEARPDSAKGARLVTYSKGFPRRVWGHAWQWATPATALWRAKVGVFARIHRIKDFSGLSERFGPRWAFWFRDLIETLNVGDVFEQLQADPELAQRLAVALLAFPEAKRANRMHIVPPRPPLDDDGKAFPVPARLAWVFEWHCRNWGKPIPERKKTK